MNLVHTGFVPERGCVSRQAIQLVFIENEVFLFSKIII